MKLLPRRMHLMMLGLLGAAALLLMTGCVGVAGVAKNNSSLPGTTPANGTKNSSAGNSATFVPGTLEFTGQVQSVSATSIVVSMPDGSASPAAVINAQTDFSEFNGAKPTQGQTVQIKETANSDGSFTATELKPTDSGEAPDLSKVKYSGTTTSTIGSDNLLHFQVGEQVFSFPVSGTTQFKDFGSAQAIQSNQAIKVTVQFQQGTPTVLEVSSPND